jgi:uncharacterized protein involved in high-affinity Fe2+ transport
MTVQTIEVRPSRYGRTGYEGCAEHEADVFSVRYFGKERGYGEGWFPAYDADMKYQYKTRAEAELKAAEFAAQWQ